MPVTNLMKLSLYNFKGTVGKLLDLEFQLILSSILNYYIAY